MDERNNNLPVTGDDLSETARLRQRVAQLEVERDQYRRSLALLLGEQSAPGEGSSDEELDRLAGEALRLNDFGDELRQLLQGP